jgi:hypothetical protein
LALPFRRVPKVTFIELAAALAFAIIFGFISFVANLINQINN